MSFQAVSTTPDGCICSDSQRLDAINQNLGELGNKLINESKRVSVASFTRPATTPAYTALDVVGIAAGTPIEFTNIGPVGGGVVFLTALSLRMDTASIPAGMGGFRLHLYKELPSSLADDEAFNVPEADRAQYLGFIELSTPLDLGATLWAATEEQFYAVRKEVQLVSSSIWGHLQTINGFTAAASVVHSLTLSSLE